MKEVFDNSGVRRKDRLLGEQRAAEILAGGEYGFLSMVGDDNSGYGIPISFAWDNGYYIYFHCAPAGYKLNCLDNNPNVSFCVVGKTMVVSKKFTTAYESVIVKGRVERDLVAEERMKALSLILDKYSPQDKEVGLKYAEKSFARTEILRLTIEHVSGKAKYVTP